MIERSTFLKWMSLTPFLYPMANINEVLNFLQVGQNTPKMPVLFLGHGSPMNAIEENQFVKGFREMAKTIPVPKAVVCISAHWYTKGTMITGMEKPETIHDFYGFPQELYDVQYPAPGSPLLAESLKEMLIPVQAELSYDWGLDHGAWSVLKHLFPKADIPVIQMSIDRTLRPEEHFNLGKKLSFLRTKGVLIVGSGNIVHNLSMVDFANFHKDDYGYDWAIEAKSQMNDFILEENYKPLFNYHQHSKAFQNAIPTPDHFLPLMYILSNKTKNEDMVFYNDKLLAGSLSMTSIKIG